MSLADFEDFADKYDDGGRGNYPSQQETNGILVKGLIKLVRGLFGSGEGLDALSGTQSKWTPSFYESENAVKEKVLFDNPITLGMLNFTNEGANPVYVRLYDSAILVGTAGTPVGKYRIPGNTSGTGSNVPLPPSGLEFKSGVVLRITTGQPDTDDTAVTAGDVITNYGYK